MRPILHTLNSRPSDCHRGELDLPLARVEMVSGDTARTPDEGWTAGSQSTEYSGTAIRLVLTSAARFSRQCCLRALPSITKLRTTAGWAASAGYVWSGLVGNETGMPLSGKTVLVTGASAGIGRATAIALAQAGAKILATGRRRTQLDALKQQCGSAVETIAGDLNDG